MKAKRYLLLSAAVLLLASWGCKTTDDTKEKPNPEPIELKPAPTPAIKSKDKEATKAAVENLFKVVKSGKFADAAPLLVYRGDDAARRWKSPCDYSKAEEKMYVDKTFSKLQVILDGLDSHSYSEFIQEKEGEGIWNVWVTNLKYADGNEEQKAFAFLKIGGKYLLGDID